VGFRCRTAEEIRSGTAAASGPTNEIYRNGGLRTRDICIPGLHIDSIKVKTRDFR
jgi:hypothetical protein